ncbi:hypothetical protein PENSPDRAFT_688976 [Peniophora sp. CONT]|nr:hypothetical protein PENSPDRAFT_688976 [Peniophora sp. CONT]
MSSLSATPYPTKTSPFSSQLLTPAQTHASLGTQPNIKKAVDDAKRLLANVAANTNRQTPQDAAVTQIQWLQLRVNGLEAERANLAYKLSVANGHLTSAHKQLNMFHTQCNALAKEAGVRRQQHVEGLHPPTTFFDPETMQCRVVSVPNASLQPFKNRMFDYAKQLAKSDRPSAVAFASRPPAFLPICIKQIAQHGYWFVPVDPPNPEETFELLVESSTDCWMYIGRYQSFPLAEAYSMTLAEWSILDEETKNHLCLRMLRKELPSVDGISPYAPALLSLRAKLDMAEYVAPCSGLRCVGYNTQFEAAISAALGDSTPFTKEAGSVQATDSAKR